MRERRNLPTALVLPFELSAMVLVASSCCSMCEKFRPSVTADAADVVCLPMPSVGVHARRTYCCSHPVHTGFLVHQPYNDELNTEER